MDLFAYARTLEDRLEINHYYSTSAERATDEICRVPGLYKIISTREEVLDSFGYTDAIVCRIATLGNISGDQSEHFPVPDYAGGAVDQESSEKDLRAWVDALERRLMIHEITGEDGTTRPATVEEKAAMLGTSDAVAMLDAMIEEIEGPRRKVGLI